VRYISCFAGECWEAQNQKQAFHRKSLEAIAFGLLGSEKQMGDLKNTATSRPSQRARKAAKDSVPVASCGDAKISCMDAKEQ
jgi:hypothetical protein